MKTPSHFTPVLTAVWSARWKFSAALSKCPAFWCTLPMRVNTAGDLGRPFSKERAWGRENAILLTNHSSRNISTAQSVSIMHLLMVAKEGFHKSSLCSGMIKSTAQLCSNPDVQWCHIKLLESQIEFSLHNVRWSDNIGESDQKFGHFYLVNHSCNTAWGCVESCDIM